jgi:hypothetical protein
MAILKVCTKYTYPEAGTRNGRVYSPEVLEEAFNDDFFKEQCTRGFIPVKTDEDDFLGYATARLESGNTVIVEAAIRDSTYINILKELEDNSVGFILAGYGDVEYRDGKCFIVKVDFDSVVLTSCPAVSYTTKIYRDDITYPSRYSIAPWITDDFGYNERFRTKLVE